MIVTREKQQILLNRYIQEHHNTDQCDGFVDGINETLKLVDVLLKSEKTQLACKSCGCDSFHETSKQEICIGDDQYRYVTASVCDGCGKASDIDFYD